MCLFLFWHWSHFPQNDVTKAVSSVSFCCSFTAILKSAHITISTTNFVIFCHIFCFEFVLNILFTYLVECFSMGSNRTWFMSGCSLGSYASKGVCFCSHNPFNSTHKKKKKKHKKTFSQLLNVLAAEPGLKFRRSYFQLYGQHSRGFHFYITAIWWLFKTKSS